MATINYKVQGSYPPFAVELRENSETGAIIQTMVALSADTQYSFTSVPDYGDFFVVAYDNAFGNNSDDVSFTTTTTTTPAPTTTTTTTAAPTTTTTTTLTPTTTTTTTSTTTTTTLPPTTTTTTTITPNPKIYGAITPTFEPATYTNRNSKVTSGDNYELRWTTDSNNTQKTSGGGPNLLYNVDVNFNWQAGGPVCFDSSTVQNVIGMPIAANIFGQYTVTLPAGQNEGYVHFYVCNTSGGFVDASYVVSIDNAADPTQQLGTDSDSSDTRFVTASSAGCTYGYVQLASTANVASHVVAP